LRRNDSPEDLDRRLRAARTRLREQFNMVPINPEPAQRDRRTVPGAQPDLRLGGRRRRLRNGRYELGPDQALIIEGTSPDCVFWNLCLWNPFLHTYDFRRERVTINGTEVQYEPDGSWRVVVSPSDPGHPNWVSTAGRGKGLIWLRWFLPERPRRGPSVASSISRTCNDHRPADIRLTDLADPVYPAAAQPIRDGLAGYGATLRLEPEALRRRPRRAPA
jgi:hypothetical protein